MLFERHAGANRAGSPLKNARKSGITCVQTLTT
jgi:hypothetical protein